MLVARQLRDTGFIQMRARSLKGKQIDALLARWRAEVLSTGTLKNRVAHLRWWAEKVGKAGVIPAENARVAIPDRHFVTNDTKARQLGNGLARVSDPHVRMSLALQQAFGLRREEFIKFRPSYADRGDHIALQGSWTKGGRPRTVPITTREQRVVLGCPLSARRRPWVAPQVEGLRSTLQRPSEVQTTRLPRVVPRTL